MITILEDFLGESSTNKLLTEEITKRLEKGALSEIDYLMFFVSDFIK